MGTIGVSTERGIVRGVLLGADSSADDAVHELIEAKEHVVDDSGDTASAVVSMLDAIDADEKAGDVRGTAVAYRDAEERHAIVSALASSRWSASSLVSAKAAQLASLAAIPGLDQYRNLLMYEAAPGLVTMSVVDSTRTRVLASDSVVSTSHTAEAVGSSVRRGWELLDSSDVVPDAVVLFGSRAGDPDVVPVLETGFSVPVVLATAPASTTAFGAALLAARDVSGGGAAGPGVVAAGAGRSKRPYVLAAAAAVLLGAGGLGVAGILSSSDSTDVSTNAGPATSAGSPAQMGATGSASPSAQRPTAQSPVAAPVPPPADTAAPQTPDAVPVDDAPAPQAWTQDPTTKAWTPAPTAAWKEPSTATPPPPAQAAAPVAPAAPAAPTTVGNPNGSWLFPGESPPPPPGDPSANAWWTNHFELKDRWLHHE